MGKLRTVSVAGALALSVAAEQGHAQAPREPVCYALEIGPWQPAFSDDAGYHRLPATIRLDTLLWPDGARHLEPNIAYPYQHAFPSTPRWEANADTVRLVWSNGFAPTRVTLVRDGDELIGEAIAESDSHRLGEPPRPRAAVTARRVSCVGLRVAVRARRRAESPST